jgi:hypothetical protein
MSETPEKKVGISVKPTTPEKQPDGTASNPTADTESGAPVENNQAKPAESSESAQATSEQTEPAVAPKPAVKAPQKPAHRAQAAPVLRAAATSASATKQAPTHRPAAVDYAGSEATTMGEVIIDGVAAAVAIAFFILILQQFLG